MDYWEECIREAFDDAGIIATEKQIDTVLSWVEGAHENYGVAHGYDAIPSPAATEAENKLRELKADHDKRKGWELSTEPCKYCITTGNVNDGWGRDVQCDWCGGSGRY